MNQTYLKFKCNTSKMKCLLALISFKSMFHFYTLSEHKKPEVFDVFKKYGKVILNNFKNDYLIFVCSPKAELYSIGSQYAMIVPEPTTFRLRCRHANHHTTNTVKFGCLSLNVNVVGSKTIHSVLQPY